jgi:hypothetical protein
VQELDDLYADGSEVSFQAQRSIPRLEAALKETLRLHPPLVLLLRVAQEDFEIGGDQPGHYPLKDLPSTVWPPPVAAGQYVTQARFRS